MASFSRIENLISTIASGITGIGLLKDYDIRTPELEYFIESFGDLRVSVSALAPIPQMKNYSTSIEAIFSRLLARLPELRNQNVPEGTLEQTLKDAKELHSVLDAVYTGFRTYTISI